MLTLLVNGSPHVNGQTMALAREVLAVIPGTVEEIHLYARPALPCTGCGACETSLDCPLDDVMPRYRRELEKADILLLASPLHFVSLTAPLVAFLGRLQPYWHARGNGSAPLAGKRRVGGLAVSGGSTYRRMFEPARAVAAAAFNSLGIPFVGMATAAETDELPVADNPEALESARHLGGALAAVVG